MKGAVHINDLVEATLLSIDHRPSVAAPTYIIDGAYDYDATEIARWDSQGAGSTFAARYQNHIDVAQQYGLKTHIMPRILAIAPDQRLPGYAPAYSLLSLLEDLKQYGMEGPPEPKL